MGTTCHPHTADRGSWRSHCSVHLEHAPDRGGLAESKSPVSEPWARRGPLQAHGHASLSSKKDHVRVGDHGSQTPAGLKRESRPSQRRPEPSRASSFPGLGRPTWRLQMCSRAREISVSRRGLSSVSSTAPKLNIKTGGINSSSGIPLLVRATPAHNATC